MKITEPTYIAHQTEEIQTIKEHAFGTAQRCQEFALPDWKSVLFVMGLYHDIGKYQPAFQRRIRGESIRVEHAACGAEALLEQYGKHPITLLMAYAITGHHSGLPDGGTPADRSDQPTLHGRLKRTFGPYQDYETELGRPVMDLERALSALIQDCKGDGNRLIDTFAFFTRYAYSCLVDADAADTAAFCCPDKPRKNQKQNFEAALTLVNAAFDRFRAVTPLQKARRQIQTKIFADARKPGDIYLLDMPTGSGKTLTSVKLALEKAVAEGKKRIIYIIPYNSIIDQTAEQFQKLFGDQVTILRHQSTFSYDDSEESRLSDALEDWDAPFIITTFVQFFESLYGSKRRKLRKLHRMADSILIFDEVHLMPWDYLEPCLQGVAYITRYLDSKALFLTATMPDFTSLFHTYALPDSRIIPLTADPAFTAPFQKCRYQYLGTQTMDALLRKGGGCPSALFIVNTKRTARMFYDACHTGHCYHLSTYMTPRDRKQVLRRIRQDLQALEQDYPDFKGIPAERRITIVSTSLIEAGVDLDVFTVFRERAGLDHILQAGGRCNREGKQAQGTVYVFDLKGDTGQPAKGVEAHLAGYFLNTYPDVSDPATIREYYAQLVSLRTKTLTHPSIHSMCSRLESIPFRTYAEQFRLLDVWTKSLVVPQDGKSLRLIRELASGRKVSLSALQEYTCSITPRELDDLLCQHAVKSTDTGIFYLSNPDYYKDGLGITFQASDYFL